MRKRECYMKRHCIDGKYTPTDHNTDYLPRHRQAVTAAVNCSYLFFIFYIIVTTTTVAQVRFDEQNNPFTLTSYLVVVQLFQATLYAY